MHSKLASKIKGIIFSERTSPRPARKDESHTELISEKAGPSSDTQASVGEPKKRMPSLKREGSSSSKKRRRSSKLHKQGSVTMKQQDQDMRVVVKTNEIQPVHPRRHQLLRNQPRHDSTQQVHVCDVEVGEECNSEPIKHYIDSCHNTPTRTIMRADDPVSNDKRVLINVGGVRHETHVSTLGNVPNSRLSRLAEAHVCSGKGKQEYFFDRHPAVFNSIIDFYRTGELHVPLEVCGAVVKRELDFWQIDETDIKACCWRHYRHYIENERILGSFSRSLEQEQMTVDLSGYKGWRLWQAKLWLILDHPRTSKPALAYGIVSFLFVAASIAGFCLETLPELRPQARIDNNTNQSLSCGNCDCLNVVLTSNQALSALDFICTIFFTGELILRFLVSPGKLKFIRSPMNIIDLLALVPLYVQLILDHSNRQACYKSEQFVIEIMFILRIFRMFRIFHLVKHYQALKVLVYALNASLQELMMLFIFLLIGMLIFSTMIYYAERRNDTENSRSEFSTIPIGFWWAIITMTTVGYGDITPSTPIGYIVGTGCSICGVLLIALTIPVISNNFGLFYEHVRFRSVPKDEKEEESGIEDETDFPDYPPDYGSTAFKMHTIPSTESASAKDLDNQGLDYNTMNGRPKGASKETANKTDACGDKHGAKNKFVPIARFGDTFSTTDIVFQDSSDELLQTTPSSPFNTYGKLKFMDTDSDGKDGSPVL